MPMRKPTLLTVFLVVLMDLVGFGIIMPLLPFVARHYQASGMTIGFLFASYSLMQFLFAPLWGRWSDSVGRRPVMLLSLFGSTVPYLLLACSESLWLILLSRIFAGICGANISVANAYIADITTPENRSRGMGLIGAAFGIGFVVGPALGGLLGRHGFLYPALAAAAICGINWVLALLYLPESRTPRKAPSPFRWVLFQGWGSVLKRENLTILIGISFLCNVAFALWETTFGLFLSETPRFGYAMETFSYLLAYVAFLVAVIQGGLIGRLVGRFGERRLLLGSLFLFFLSLVLMGASQIQLHLWAALTLLGLANGLNRPVIFGLISKEASEDEQGMVLGVAHSAGSLARIVGPVMGGWMLDQRLSLPLEGGAVLMLLALALAVAGTWKTKRRPEGRLFEKQN
jgi:DHA1 family tetracycline resistance protein-like MFS transporter